MKSLSRVQLFVTPWTVAHQVRLSIGFPRQEYWSGLPFPSPGDFPDPGIEPGLYRLSHQGIPRILEWVAISSSRESSWSRDQTQGCCVSCIARWALDHSRHLYPAVQFSRSGVSDSATPWTAAQQASLSITNSWTWLKLTSIKSVMPSNPHPLSSPSPPARSPSQHQGLFKRVSSSPQVAKVLELQLQHQSFQWIFRTDFL